MVDVRAWHKFSYANRTRGDLSADQSLFEEQHEEGLSRKKQKVRKEIWHKSEKWTYSEARGGKDAAVPIADVALLEIVGAMSTRAC